MKIALAQINTCVGDIGGNTAKMLEYTEKAKALGADLLLFPEMSVTGYPPNDLLYDRAFIEANRRAIRTLAEASGSMAIIAGFVEPADGKHLHGLHNSAALLQHGKIVGIQHKTLLPTYDVFDEHRYFTPAGTRSVFTINGTKIGITICEDIWDDDYDIKPAKDLAAQGAEILINISASPFHLGKGAIRRTLAERHARETGLPLMYCNQVGGQDELVFDGHSLAVDGKGRLIAEGRQFEEELIIVDLGAKGIAPKKVTREEEMFNGIVLGVRDYYRKQGLRKAVIGLSGGIDSALVAVIAAAAVGPANVIGVSMPSRVSSQHSKDDAATLAKNLGIRFHTIPIQASIDLAKTRFTAAFGEYQSKVTVENLQARERGKILMEIANDQGALVLSTGNKTEMALGYCTLYGDMCGGLAVIADLGKTEVYSLARWINREKEIIPRSSIDKIPSAELAEGQYDPFDYPVISPLVNRIVEDYASDQALLAEGYKAEDIGRCRELIRRNEYKRKQAPIGIKITPRAFGIGRKMPIVNAWRGI